MLRKARTVAYSPPAYAFRVRILGGGYAPEDCREIWREIEITAGQTLQALGEAIPYAFNFDDPHMWSFFLSGKAWDTESEYRVSMGAGFGDLDLGFDDAEATPADEVLIRDVPYPGKSGKREFLYLFDYGDGWYFGVKLLRVSNAIEPGARYPRVVASHGMAPPQYPDFEDEDDEE